MTEQYWKLHSGHHCDNCGRPKSEHRQYRDNKPPHCPTVAPMPERKLPVVQSLFVKLRHAQFTNEEASFVIGWHKRKADDDVEYIPRAQANEVVHCLDCEHWRPEEFYSIYRCDHEQGLKNPLEDGSDFCRYAERKASGE